ncbi:hypothetical protein [Zoogloea sp.]|uniref:hypothetical protein n=1 Tax=Zoogloea sp. TaxID=49181 RepID=UPI001416835A|nr:MAG: hypothetical protein F9K15_10565 [Zoogloea sp.]
MGPISELSGTVLWRAITSTGETEIFHLKLIAEDWAGVEGKVEAVVADLHSLHLTGLPAALKA